MNHFHFLRPDYFFFFIPLIFLMVLWIWREKQANSWLRVCSKDLIPYVLGKHTKQCLFPYLLTFSTLSLLIIALAGPSWQRIPQPLVKAQSGLVIALDLSPSMNAEDIKPSRLQRAIYKINDLLSMRQEGQTALIVFSEEPFVVTPLTEDVETIKSLLPVLETSLMPAIGHRVDKAIKKGADLLMQGGISQGSILLITSELSGSEEEKSIALAKEHGIAISVLGIGSEEAVPIPQRGGGILKDSKGALILTKLAKENLKRLTQATHGLYTTLTVDDSDLHKMNPIFSSNPHSSAQENTELMLHRWHDQGYLLVLLALPLTLFLFRRGVLASFIFLLPYSLEAYTWNDLWKTPDQQAEELFHREEYQQAQELFQNPAWRGAASYKLGDYASAAQAFQGNESAEGLYNFGTAQAKLGHFEEALAAYTKTLASDPHHEDALYNKKVIEDFLKQQQENQNNQQNQSENQQQQNQSEDQQQQNQTAQPEENRDENRSESSGKDEEDPSKQSDEEEEAKQELNKHLQDEIEEALQKEEEASQEAQKKAPSEEEEQRQIDERWLQRIKDDPGGLLRRKFLQHYRQSKQ